MLYDKQKTELIQYPIGNSCAYFEIPTGVVQIGEGAFERADSLERIIVPDGVTDIGTGAFYGCSRLRQVHIPSSAVRMDKKVFWENGVIICSDKSGCLAEEYARENGIEFRVCGGHVLRLDKTALTMRYRATAELKPTMQAEWTSSDKSVAKVDQSGKVTAVGRGTAIITAVSEDGQTARCIVTVQYTWWQWLIRILPGGRIWY